MNRTRWPSMLVPSLLVIGFAGARVIEQTIRETLPEGFQRSEYLLDHGMVDIVVPRAELRDTLIRVLSLLKNQSPPGDVVPMADAAQIGIDFFRSLLANVTGIEDHEVGVFNRSGF